MRLFFKALEVSKTECKLDYPRENFAPGMVEAMDLLVGAKRVIGAIQHTQVAKI